MTEETYFQEFEAAARRVANMDEEMYEMYERTNPFFAKVIRFSKEWVRLHPM